MKMINKTVIVLVLVLFSSVGCPQQGKAHRSFYIKGGYKLTIRPNYLEHDQGVPLYLEIKKGSELILKPVYLTAVASSMLNKQIRIFDIYKTKNEEIVAIYAKQHPDEILAVIDFENRLFYPSDQKLSSEYITRIVSALTEVSDQTGVYGLYCRYTYKQKTKKPEDKASQAKDIK